MARPATWSICILAAVMASASAWAEPAQKPSKPLNKHVQIVKRALWTYLVKLKRFNVSQLNL